MKRCSWVGNDAIEITYHDEEWGVPVYEDGKLLEGLILEGAQAGLSWITVLKRREGYRAAFDQFDAETIAQYDEEKVKSLLLDERIIRNKLKIHSVIRNARCFLEVQQEESSFSDYLWSFVDHQPIMNQWENHHELPAKSSLSEKMSKDLKKRGFNFVGPTICYAYMQAIGMVNDHLTSCFRYEKLLTEE